MKAGIDGKISDLRRQLGTGKEAEAGAGEPAPRKAGRKKRRLSAEGRANIIAALKKRWAEKHKEAEQAKAKPAKSAAKKASVKAKRTPAKKAASKTARSKPAPVVAPAPEATETQ
jgi:hypothetical protein